MPQRHGREERDRPDSRAEAGADIAGVPRIRVDQTENDGRNEQQDHDRH